MAKDEKKKKNSGGKVAGAALLFLLLAGGGGYLGFGGGSGLLPGGSSAGEGGNTLLPSTTSGQTTQVSGQESPAGMEQPVEEGINSLDIRISENDITLNGEATDLAGLEQALMDAYTDGLPVTLTDDHAIKGTYDNVTAVLERLDIPYTVK